MVVNASVALRIFSVKFEGVFLCLVSKIHDLMIQRTGLPIGNSSNNPPHILWNQWLSRWFSNLFKSFSPNLGRKMSNLTDADIFSDGVVNQPRSKHMILVPSNWTHIARLGALHWSNALGWRSNTRLFIWDGHCCILDSKWLRLFTPNVFADSWFCLEEVLGCLLILGLFVSFKLLVCN